MSKLPYGFQERLIALAPLRILNDLSRVCTNVKLFRSFCPKGYDEVQINDRHNVEQEISTKSLFFRLTTAVLRFFIIFNYIFALDISIDQLHVDEIIERKQHIYVEKALVINCNSVTSYEKVIPYISGPYTHVVLNGNVTWKQVKRLVHPNVKKTDIKATIHISSAQSYANFAKFVMRQLRDSTFW
uniref:F-box domain-containing protein n=1 Tax=Panagrellus redivivus TaxID=6233 RepID=A0A7E4ZXR3_PANRE